MMMFMPEGILVLTALLVLAWDGVSRRLQCNSSGGVVLLGLAGLILAVVAVLSPQGVAVDGLVPWMRTAKQAVIFLAGIVCITPLRQQWNHHPAEYITLLLLATVGLCVMLSADHVLMAFLGLETSSVCFYLMSAFRRNQPSSVESALKYFLQGAMATAFVLMGLALLCGTTGVMHFSEMSGAENSALNQLGAVLLLCGIGFKLALAPVHFWAPDVYQGAPSSTVAFIASASKVAGLVLLLRLAGLDLFSLQGSGWVLLSALALVSMVWGNLAALSQSNIKRLLAYSAVAHAGTVLLGVFSGGETAVMYAGITYALTLVSVFIMLDALETAQIPVQGLFQRQPFIAVLLALLILSLASVPPMAGFFAKFFLFVSCIHNVTPVLSYTLVGVALLMSIPALVYYLRVLKDVWVKPPPVEAPTTSLPLYTRLILLVLTGLVVGLGMAPMVLWSLLS